jgi:hypothetical protein
VSRLFQAIRIALPLLDDHHSMNSSDSGIPVRNPSEPNCGSTVRAPAIPSNIGYTEVRAFKSRGLAAWRLFSEKLPQEIRPVDRDDLKGPVVMSNDCWQRSDPRRGAIFVPRGTDEMGSPSEYRVRGAFDQDVRLQIERPYRSNRQLPCTAVSPNAPTCADKGPSTGRERDTSSVTWNFIPVRFASITVIE